MPDGISVSSGGSRVETEELLRLTTALEALAAEASSIRAELAYADGLMATNATGAPMSAHRAEAQLDRAAAALLLVEAEARFLALALSAAAGGYTLAEDAARRVVGAITDHAGMTIGLLAPLLTVPLILGGTSLMLAGPEGRNAFLSNPAVVSAIRAIAMGADDAILARLGVPPAIIAALGDQGIGISGLPVAAAMVAGLGRSVGLLKETEVRVTGEQRLTTAPTIPPATFADRFARIPIAAEQDGAQVVIEKYEMSDGTNRFEVYVSATVDFNPAAEGEPFDMASNISNAMGPGSGSYDAVVLTMERAGIGTDDPVQFTGYSQGGGTAAQLAASGHYDTRGLVTFGGATGQVAIPESVPAVIVEHTDDLVAALGGAQDNAHAVIVERWASEGTDFSDAPLLPGHQREGYVETVGLMDVSVQPRLVAAADALTGFTASGRLVSTTAYTTERVSGPS